MSERAVEAASSVLKIPLHGDGHGNLAVDQLVDSLILQFQVGAPLQNLTLLVQLGSCCSPFLNAGDRWLICHPKTFMLEQHTCDKRLPSDSLQEKTALVKGLQAAATAAIRRAGEEGGQAGAGSAASMEGSQRAVIRDLSRKVSELCRELADARRQQHLAQAGHLSKQPTCQAVLHATCFCPRCISGSADADRDGDSMHCEAFG